MPPHEEIRELVQQEVKKQLKVIQIIICVVSILSITTSFVQIKSINRNKQKIKEEIVFLEKAKNTISKIEDGLRNIQSKNQKK